MSKRSADIDVQQQSKIVLRSQNARVSPDGTTYTWSFASVPIRNVKEWKIRNANIPLPTSTASTTALPSPGFGAADYHVTCIGLQQNSTNAPVLIDSDYLINTFAGPTYTPTPMPEPGYFGTLTEFNNWLSLVCQVINSTTDGYILANSGTTYNCKFHYNMIADLNGKIGVYVSVIPIGTNTFIGNSAFNQFYFSVVGRGTTLNNAVQAFFGSIGPVRPFPILPPGVAPNYTMQNVYVKVAQATNPSNFFSISPSGGGGGGGLLGSLKPYLVKISFGEYGQAYGFQTDGDGGQRNYSYLLQGANNIVYTSDTNEDMLPCVSAQISSISFSLYDQLDNPIQLSAAPGPFILQILLLSTVEGYTQGTYRVRYQT